MLAAHDQALACNGASGKEKTGISARIMIFAISLVNNFV
jgi:hypothetical protein